MSFTGSAFKDASGKHEGFRKDAVMSHLLFSSSTGRWAPLAWLLISATTLLVACTDKPTAPPSASRPAAQISDAAHEGGTAGFYFLPPLVAQPTYGGSFDAGLLAGLRVTVCDYTGTISCPVEFTASSTPAITVDAVSQQYQVNWKTSGFVAGHTYRVIIHAAVRQLLGYAEVLLSDDPGRAPSGTDVVVMKAGRTIPIKFRIETGVVCLGCGIVSPSLSTISASPTTMAIGERSTITVTARDVNGNPVQGARVSLDASPGVVSLLTQPGPTDASGVATGSVSFGDVGSKTVSAAVSSGGDPVSVTPPATITVTSRPGTPTNTLISGNGVVGDRDHLNQFTLDGVNWQDAFIVDGPGRIGSYGLIPGTLWISDDPDFGGFETEWRVRTSFVLPQGYSSPSISIDVLADNGATFFLNGVQIGGNLLGANFSGPPENVTATDPTLFHVGTNTLEIVVTNFGGPTALDYKALVTFDQAGGGLPDLFGVSTCGPNNALAVGAGGTILHYDGTGWSPQTSGTTSDLRGVLQFNNCTEASAVGAAGTILHYDGVGWSLQASQTASTLYWVDLSDVTSGFAAGARGTILHYDGSTWTPQPSGTTNDLFVIGSLSPTNALAAGTAGTILRLDGTTWGPLPSGTTNALRGGTGSPGDLFLVGDGGTILHSSDAVTWSAQASGTTNDLTAAEEHLFAVGAAGTILHYNGTSWSAQSSPTTVRLNGIQGSSTTDIFAVGAQGTILHYDGTSWTRQR
ncbi:MAG TPA: Ig-like domain-containing protein [Gemmatimonadales bacterium]